MPAKKATKKTTKKTTTKRVSGSTSKKTATKKSVRKPVPKKAAVKKTTKKQVAKKAAKPKTAKKATKPKAAAKKAAAKKKVTAKAVRGSKAFADAESKAQQYAKDPKKLGQLFEEAAEKSKSTPKGVFGEAWAYLQAMVRLIKAYANGSYREVSWGSLVIIVLAIIYFVSPFDLIPDFIPVAGYIDDALVISWALKQVRDELDAFMEWELQA